MKLKDIKYRLRIKEAEELLADWKRKGDILIVPLKGELDHHQADKVRDFLDRLLEDASIRHLILDLSDLFFMDSSGIGVFIGRYKTISKRGGQVCITNVNTQLHKVLELSGLYRILKKYDTVQHAVDGIRRVSV
jgi:stage II sporulation protein AA (anti-sigma F factor antagonist)